MKNFRRIAPTSQPKGAVRHSAMRQRSHSHEHSLRLRLRSVFRSPHLAAVTVVLALLASPLAITADPSVSPQSLPVSVQVSSDTVTLANGFLHLTFDRSTHRIVHLFADHTGQGRDTMELLAPAGITFPNSISSATGSSPAQVQIETQTPRYAVVHLSWHSGAASSPVQLTLSLGLRDRGLRVQASLPAGTCGIELHLRQWFLLGDFRRGVVQYVAGESQSFTSTNALRLFYTLDHTNGSVALVPAPGHAPAEVTMISGTSAQDSGILLRTHAASAARNTWTNTAVSPCEAHSGPTVLAFTLYGNDLPWPAYRADSDLNQLTTSESDDLSAYLTAVYGSAAGVLGSYLQPGSAYPTLAHPKRAYGAAFNFFDPDAWETVTTLAYSGDPLLQTEARRILERSLAAQLPDGQIPHHFDDGLPRYVSLAGSRQTGPNIFWVLAATEYAAATGDGRWLRAHYSSLRRATDWVLSGYDPREHLIHADGPLFIDVFRRSGFTLDTNVVAIDLLGHMSDAATFCHDPATAARYNALIGHLRQGLLQHLWNGHDHFITEILPDGTRRDFVDYDGNFGALAFDVLPDPADRRRLLARLDSGPHVHPGGYGTWVSERRYEKVDCYNGNDGDSDVAMARIWWLDMLARVQLGDRSTLLRMLDQVRDDLRRNVWMPERFDAAGLPAHNGYYHEYPEVYTIVLREMLYGVRLGMTRVTLHPFGVTAFALHLGTLRVDYSPARISVLIPGSGPRVFTIYGLAPGGVYHVSGMNRMLADPDGMLRFRAPAGKPLFIAPIASQSPTRLP